MFCLDHSPYTVWLRTLAGTLPVRSSSQTRGFQSRLFDPAAIEQRLDSRLGWTVGLSDKPVALAPWPHVVLCSPAHKQCQGLGLRSRPWAGDCAGIADSAGVSLLGDTTPAQL